MGIAARAINKGASFVKTVIRGRIGRHGAGANAEIKSESQVQVEGETSSSQTNNTETQVGEDGEMSETIQFDNKEIDEIAININNDLKGDPTFDHKSVPSRSCTSSIVSRVPRHLREAHKDAFDPKFVSIGPIHHGKSHLKAMEEHKLRFLKRLLGSNRPKGQPSNRTTTDDDVGDDANDRKVVQNLVVAMKKLEVEARGCYSETFDNFGSSEFIRMMILDGCFIVELMHLFARSAEEHVDDPIFSTCWMVPNLQHDLLLLENQLPFIVLKKLFDITRSNNKEAHFLENLALKFFDPLLPCEKMMKGCPLSDKTPDHLLGLFRSSFVKFNGSERDRKSSSVVEQKMEPEDMHRSINCVRELQEAGIKFKKAGERHLLNIEFKDGILKIPPLHIDDHSGSVFLNFLAYEQCNQTLKPYFTHYVLFLDRLVNSSKDVEILHYKGIIDHSLGSDEEVADLFNKLCKEVVHDVDHCYISKELKDINQFYSTKCHRWRAQLRHKYFVNPWALMSLSAAMFLLFLTTIQTVFSVVSYVLPPSN